MKKIYISLCTLALSLGFVSCVEDEPDCLSIFDTISEPQRDELDTWLYENYTLPYNVDFQYKWKDIESDKKYTLVPADSARSAKLAIIVKHLWFGAYDAVMGSDFLKESTPRILTLIGSPAYNNNGTMVLGTAEGGYKVVLYMVNELTDATLADYETLNKYYFTTMHHEFTHILNQKIPYDTSYDLISESDYVSGDWYQVSETVALQKGFIRNYAMSEGREDFAETASQYITNPDEVWAAKLAKAGTSGASIINQKLELIRTYFKEAWNMDIDAVHEEVIRRANELGTLDLEHLN